VKVTVRPRPEEDHRAGRGDAGVDAAEFPRHHRDREQRDILQQIVMRPLQPRRPGRHFGPLRIAERHDRPDLRDMRHDIGYPDQGHQDGGVDQVTQFNRQGAHDFPL